MPISFDRITNFNISTQLPIVMYKATTVLMKGMISGDDLPAIITFSMTMNYVGPMPANALLILSK